MRSDRGFTLAETLVAFLITGVVLTVLWAFYGAEHRRSLEDQGRLAGLTGALMLDEVLSHDLERLVLLNHNPSSPGLYTITEPVWLPPPYRTATFMRSVDEPALPGFVRAVEVSYLLDPDTSRVVRREGTTATPFRNLLAEELQFQLHVSQVQPRGLGLTSPPFSSAETEGVMFLQYRLTCVSETEAQDARSRDTTAEKVTLVGAVPLQVRQSIVTRPYWQQTDGEMAIRSP